jgi:AcrR family transcriptional regulator
MERVARTAGYSRGAIYHQFATKQELALAVITWLVDAWRREVGPLADEQPDAARALLALARGFAQMCRRDIAQAPLALRVEFSGQPAHPVGRAVEASYAGLLARCAKLIVAGRAEGSIPAGPPAPVVAAAFVGALEGTVIATTGHRPHDETLAVRAAAGVLGLSGAQ